RAGDRVGGRVLEAWPESDSQTGRSAPQIDERTGGVFAMNGMNDQRFHDLAMKTIARQATEAERAELDSLLVGNTELKAEFERLRADVGIASELLPMAEAAEATAPDFPAYARERLQTKVRQSL